MVTIERAEKIYEMHAHENSAKNQRKHSKQNKTNCESADSGTDFTAGLDDKLA
jgi:hypothetical protein